MRRLLLSVPTGLLVVVALLTVLSTADARNGNYVVVDKVVEGPVPAGTVFEIEVDCDPTQAANTNPAPDPDPVTLSFDENGDPLGEDKVSATLFETCTVTETVTGGATVSYACTIDPPTNGAMPDVQFDASCADDQTVVFGEVIGAEGTVAVTNTFTPGPEPDPLPADATAPADVVAARPTFTG